MFPLRKFWLKGVLKCFRKHIIIFWCFWWMTKCLKFMTCTNSVAWRSFYPILSNGSILSAIKMLCAKAWWNISSSLIARRFSTKFLYDFWHERFFITCSNGARMCLKHGMAFNNLLVEAFLRISTIIQSYYYYYHSQLYQHSVLYRYVWLSVTGQKMLMATCF